MVGPLRVDISSVVSKKMYSFVIVPKRAKPICLDGHKRTHISTASDSFESTPQHKHAQCECARVVGTSRFH